MGSGRRLFRFVTRLLIALTLLDAGLANAAPLVSVAMPEGFADLAEHQRVVADFSFGGRPIGQFEIEFWPGGVRLVDPDRVVAAIPGLSDTAAVRDALAAPALDPNVRYLCNAADCAVPTPEIASLVFDARHYRVTLQIAPRFLAVRPVMRESFLAADRGGWSLVDQAAAAMAGGDGQRTVYDLRDRAIVAKGDARLIAEGSVSSGGGASLDTFAAQLDRHDIRYTAGAYYAQGVELTGRRRIVGVGFASQYDTRTDRELISGTPIVVFLGQRSRVDLLVGGRLMSSHSYEAGNQTLDTAALPDGSYEVDIHIQEASGAERTERRFFTKNGRIPPAGKTAVFADAGFLALDRKGSLLDLSHTPFAEAGVARRMGSHLAWDATVIGTSGKAIGQIGATVMWPAVQARVAVLGSSRGDYGVIAQAGSTSGSRLGYSFDLRRVSTRGGSPLVPLEDRVRDPFSLGLHQQQNRLAASSYSQAVGNLSWRVSRAQLGVSAYVRRDRGQGRSYAIGPTLHWSILRSSRVTLGFDGSVAQTDRGRTIAAGLNLRVFGGRSSYGASVGAQTGVPGDEHRVGAVAAIDGSVQRTLGAADVAATGSVQRQGGDGTLVQGGVEARGPFGDGAASVVRRFDGDESSTQYGLSFQTAFVAGRHVVALGTKEQNDAVIAVALRGPAGIGRFEVLVDDTPRGRVGPGERLTLAVQPYRRYAVRVRPIGTALTAFDSRARTVDAFPGTVAALDWKVATQVAMFGRLVRPDGTPVASADLRTGDDIAATDDKGWFQLQAAGDAVLTARDATGRTCRATLAAKPAATGYTALGVVICKP